MELQELYAQRLVLLGIPRGLKSARLQEKRLDKQLAVRLVLLLAVQPVVILVRCLAVRLVDDLERQQPIVTR